jgi:hypothetical protein
MLDGMGVLWPERSIRVTGNGDMKYTLFRRRTTRYGNEIAVGRRFVWLIWLVLTFILILVGHSAGLVHWP